MKRKISSLEDLEIWQKGRDLRKDISKLEVIPKLYDKLSKIRANFMLSCSVISLPKTRSIPPARPVE